jgi:hypothetical protein
MSHSEAPNPADSAKNARFQRRTFGAQGLETAFSLQTG